MQSDVMSMTEMRDKYAAERSQLQFPLFQFPLFQLPLFQLSFFQFPFFQFPFFQFPFFQQQIIIQLPLFFLFFLLERTKFALLLEPEQPSGLFRQQAVLHTGGARSASPSACEPAGRFPDLTGSAPVLLLRTAA